MLVGTTILKMGAAVFYSPTFPRGGEAVTFTVDAVGEIGNTQLDIVLEHRNLEDTTWAALATLFNITATGIASQSTSGVKELCRLKYSFTGGSDGNGFHIVLAAPAWRPY